MCSLCRAQLNYNLLQALCKALPNGNRCVTAIFICLQLPLTLSPSSCLAAVFVFGSIVAALCCTLALPQKTLQRNEISVKTLQLQLRLDGPLAMAAGYPFPSPLYVFLFDFIPAAPHPLAFSRRAAATCHLLLATLPVATRNS